MCSLKLMDQKPLDYLTTYLYLSIDKVSMILVLVEESDNDYRGELSNEDFANAENPQFARVSKGGEVNYDTNDLYEGDIMITSSDGDGGLDDVTTIMDKKWPKIKLIQK